MVHIQDLPIELLKHILSFIADHENESSLKHPDRAKAEGRTADELETNDKHDADEVENLRNVCLVSRLFRDLAQPLLFNYFDENGLSGDIRKTISFAKTIYRHPDLGKHVQCVSMTPIPLTPIPFSLGGPSCLDVEDSVIFKRAIQDLRLADQEKTWISAMEKSDLSLFLALLVNKTPNLRQLFLPGGQFFTKPFIHLFNRNPSFLPNLEYIWVECDDAFSGYNIASYEQLLTLPKLVSTTFEYGDLDDASFPSTWTPGTLTTEEVAFYQCHMDAGAIQKFMQACKKLKSFTYDNFNLDPRFWRTPSSQSRPPTQGHEYFHLEFARDPWEIENLEEYLSSRVKIGSFRDFSVLDTISISHALLPPHPQFPHSLKTLHINDCNSSIRDMVQNIAIDCKNGFYPNFTELKVLTTDVTQPIKLPGQRIPPGKTPEQCFLSLRDLFEGTKVDFQILPYKMPDFDEHDDSDLDYEDYEEYRAGSSGTGQIAELVNLFMQQQTLRDPDFSPLFTYAASDNSWETVSDE